MSFGEFKPAVREGVPLLIGMSGPTGSGKTYSALRLASGLAAGKPFALIDTENGRALHYADEFDFDHGSLQAPFNPDSYWGAIDAADAGRLSGDRRRLRLARARRRGRAARYARRQAEKLAGSDFSKRQAMTMLAWVEPKLEHKRFVTRLRRCRCT
jgi:hypothetical protein